MPDSPRPWWKTRPVLIGGAVVAVGLIAGGVWMATRGDGPDSGPTGASALSRDEESQRQALEMVNDALGLGAVQDFQIIVDLTVMTDEGPVSVYDSVLAIVREGAGDEVVIEDPSSRFVGPEAATALHRTWAPVSSIQGEIVTPDGEILPTVSVDFGLLGFTEFAILDLRLLLAEEGDLLGLDMTTDLDPVGSQMLVVVATADYRDKRIHVAPGDGMRIRWPDIPGVEEGSVLVPTIIFGQTRPGDQVVELTLDPHELFAYRWGLGLVDVLGDDESGTSVLVGAGPEASEPTGQSGRATSKPLVYNPEDQQPQLLPIDDILNPPRRGLDLNSIWTLKPILYLGAVIVGEENRLWEEHGLDKIKSIFTSSFIETTGDMEAAAKDCHTANTAFQIAFRDEFPDYHREDPIEKIREMLRGEFGDRYFGAFQEKWNLERSWRDVIGSSDTLFFPCDFFHPGLQERNMKAFAAAFSTWCRKTAKEVLYQNDIDFFNTEDWDSEHRIRLEFATRECVNWRNRSLGSGFGDPHMTTLDGKQYDNMAVGEFLLFDNGTATVQMRTGKIGEHLSQVVALSAQIGASKVVFQRGPVDEISMQAPIQVLVDGEMVELEVGETAMVGGGAILESWNGWVVVWPDRTILAVHGVDPRARHFSFVVETPHPGAIGLLGDGDGNPDNDFVTRSGTQLPPNADEDFTSFYAAYIESWRITQGESLFHYQPGESTATFTIEGYPTQPYGLDDLDPDEVAAAEVTCREAGVSTEQILRWCMFDVAATGDPGYAVGAVLADMYERSRFRTGPDLDFAGDCPVDNPDGPTWARVVIGDDCYVFDSGSQPWQWCSVAEFGDYMGGEYALDIEGNPVFDFLDFQNRPYVLTLHFGIHELSASGNPAKDAKVAVSIGNGPAYVSPWEHNNWFTGIGFWADIPEALVIEYSFDPVAGRAVGRAMFTNGITDSGPPDYNPRDPALIEGSFEIVCNPG